MASWLKNVVSKLASLPDSLLVFEAKHGDRAAFGKLYLKYLDRIYRYIYFRVNQNRLEAEDMTQNVFFRAWDKLAEYENRGSFQAWLYRIAHNSVVDQYRTKTHVRLDESFVDTGVPLEETLFAREELKALSQAMRNLTDDQKQVITLKYIEGMPTHEIAKIMNKKEQAVRALQSRALKRLRELLKRYE